MKACASDCAMCLDGRAARRERHDHPHQPHRIGLRRRGPGCRTAYRQHAGCSHCRRGQRSGSLRCCHVQSPLYRAGGITGSSTYGCLPQLAAVRNGTSTLDRSGVRSRCASSSSGCVGRALGDTRMRREQPLPSGRVAILEGESLAIGTIGKDHRMPACGQRQEHIGPEHDAVVHWDRCGASHRMRIPSRTTVLSKPSSTASGATGAHGCHSSHSSAIDGVTPKKRRLLRIVCAWSSGT